VNDSWNMGRIKTLDCDHQPWKINVKRVRFLAYQRGTFEYCFLKVSTRENSWRVSVTHTRAREQKNTGMYLLTFLQGVKDAHDAMMTHA